MTSQTIFALSFMGHETGHNEGFTTSHSKVTSFHLSGLRCSLFRVLNIIMGLDIISKMSLKCAITDL